MVATLQLRKEALEAKIHEKTEELKRLCLQEADLTGVLPPETPLDPNEPPPIVRRRVGTSFSFPQSLINNLNGADDVSLNALELECKVQTNIAEAALNLANDTTANKAVRRKHRLMYRQSQRQLMDLETRLTLLRQGKHQAIKPYQIKKKPRPNTTTVDNAQLSREFRGQKILNFNHSNGMASWPLKVGPGILAEDDIEHMVNLHRSGRSSRTSQTSNSPKLSSRDMAALNSSGLPDQYTMTSSLSQPNMQDLKPCGHDVLRELKRSEKRNSGRRQWDTQSAGGTLLPNQTYPENHQPNLNRTQSLGSVDANRQSKEKEWYETCLDSAPSPPLRTSSRLPSAARMMYHMQELQIRDAVNRSLTTPSKLHAPLVRTHAFSPPPVEGITELVQSMHLSPMPSPRHERSTQELRLNDAVYIDIPEDEVDNSSTWRNTDGAKTPTQAYYHCSPTWAPPVPGMHPPHVVTQGEIQFETVVPFESPQNHTVVQAGIWQPYREVSKPFEMSDFYKYSTKFRQARQSPSPAAGPLREQSGLHPTVNQRPPVDALRQSPSLSTSGFHPLRNNESARQSPNTQMGVYQPLRPMTCQAVDARTGSAYFDPSDSNSVSAPKIV